MSRKIEPSFNDAENLLNEFCQIESYTICNKQFTPIDHSELILEIGEMLGAITLYYTIKDVDDNIEKLRLNGNKPTWEEIINLMDRIYKIVDNSRYYPIKK